MALPGFVRDLMAEEGQGTNSSINHGQPAPGNIGNAEFPRIEPDLGVTFRLNAPDAKAVLLGGGEGLATSTGRIEFVILRTDCSLPVALHLLFYKNAVTFSEWAQICP